MMAPEPCHISKAKMVSPAAKSWALCASVVAAANLWLRASQENAKELREKA
jgi:hypothetical protein